MHPSGGVRRRRAVAVVQDIADELNPRLADVFQPDDNLRPVPFGVVADVMRNQLLLEAPEVEVPTVAEQLRPVLLVLDMQRIAAEKVQQLRKHLPGPVRYAGRDNRRWPQEALAIQPRENLGWGREKDGRAQGEEIRRVARPGEDVPGDLEMPVADLDEDLGFKELRYESWYYRSQYASR